MHDMFIWLFLVHMSFTCRPYIYIYVGHCVSVSPFEDTLCMVVIYTVFIISCYYVVDRDAERSNI